MPCIRLAIVTRWSWKQPLPRVLPQMCVKPRKRRLAMRLRSRRAREKAAEVVAVAKPGPVRHPEEPALEPRYARTACGFEKSMFDTPDLQLENCERCLGSDPR